jgi:hypothetical protein
MIGGFSKEALEQYQKEMLDTFGGAHDFTECVDVFDYRLCQRDNGSYYGTAGMCRKGTEVNRDDVINEIKSLRSVTPKQAAALSALDDEDLGRVHRAVKMNALDVDSAQRVSSAVKTLAGETESGPKKKGGDNLQDPSEAEKYAKFYESGKDKTHKAPHDSSPEEVKAVLAELKDTLDAKEYREVVGALAGKGSPTKEQKAAAGWKNDAERGEAVLKSLMDNEFKDVNGAFLSWRQGLQLDHRRAGAVGGSDRPDNWIWISSPTNQAKGAVENNVKKEIRTGKLNAADADKRITELLVGKLKQNASMTPEAVAKVKEAGSMAVVHKAEAALAMKDNLPLMPADQRARLVDAAKGDELRNLMKASTLEVDSKGQPRGYRPMATGGPGLRTRSDYPSADSMRSLLRARWGAVLTSNDLKNIADIVNGSTGSSRSNDAILSDLLDKKYKPVTPLTSAQMNELKGYITRE